MAQAEVKKLHDRQTVEVVNDDWRMHGTGENAESLIGGVA